MIRSIVTSILLCFFFQSLLSCARIKEMNTTKSVNDSIINFKKAKIELNDGRQFEIKNATIDMDSSFFRYNTRNDIVTINFNELKELQYSNAHLGYPGAILGGISGLILPLKYGPDPNPAPRGDGLHFSSGGKAFLVFLAVPLGAFLGYKFGAEFYIKWNSYPISGNSSFFQPKMFIPSSNSVFLQYKLPLYKYIPF